MRASRLILVAAALPALSCTGTTGYQLVVFNAVAEGPADAQAGYTFSNELGFQVTLTKAVMHVGALYLDQSVPTAGSAEGTCTLPGTYVGEVRDGRDVDMLDPTPQAFPAQGDGSTIPAAVGQVWLSGPDVNSMSSQADALDIEGTVARLDGTSFPFFGAISIDTSSFPPPQSAALPGTSPICEQRIVREILVDITLSQGGTLILHLDPKALFSNVDFSGVKPSGDPPSYQFSMPPMDQPSRNLLNNLQASGSVYRFEWRPANP
jgi:hypothetical protein